MRRVGAKSDDLTWIRDMAATNPDWLKQHPDAVCSTIKRGLDDHETYEQTVDTILDLLTLAMKDPAYQPHFAPVVTIVQEHPASLTLPFQVDFRAVISEFQKQIAVYSRLATARLIEVDDLLQAYIRLIKTLSFSRNFAMQSGLIDQALDVARRLRDHMESARLHQTLAHYYILYGELDAAELHGRRAFSDYEYVEDAVGTADAACTLAIIYRVSLRLPKVSHYLDRALQRIEGKPADKRYATLYYEKGALCHTQKAYDAALTFYGKALVIYEAHGAAQQCAMTYHAMALAHTYLRHYDQAAALLQAARRGWEKLENAFEQVNIAFAEADLEIQRGSLQEGVAMLDAVMAAARQLDETPARDHLIDLIQKRIDEPTGAVT